MSAFIVRYPDGTVSDVSIAPDEFLTGDRDRVVIRFGWTAAEKGYIVLPASFTVESNRVDP